MANLKHVDWLLSGVTTWNNARKASDFVPDLSRAELAGADLRLANLAGAVLTKANLNGAYLENAHLAQANLLSAELHGAFLGFCNLAGASLRDAGLAGAELGDADLRKADLTGAQLRLAKLTQANLREAILMDANLAYAEFRDADLRGATITGAIFAHTSIANCDLSQVLGLTDVKHLGPSSIGVDTLYRSQGRIPEVFLRGAGVPDDLIAYIPSILALGKPVVFYSCFISYSHKNEDFAQRLFSKLRDNKLRVWFAPKDIAGGKKLHEQIDEAIRLHDKLLLVLSDQSICSEWVMTEVRRARKREVKEGRQVLFPIRLTDMQTLKEWSCFDADTGKDLAVEVREYFIPDFSNWKDHDSFERAFDRLLRDLRKSEAKVSDPTS